MHHKIDLAAAVGAFGSSAAWVLGWLPAVLACVASALSIAWYIYRFKKEFKK